MIKEFPAFVRKYKDSAITYAPYDVESKIVSGFRFELPIPWVEEYYIPSSKVEGFYAGVMYKKLIMFQRALASVLINSKYVAVLTPSEIVVDDIFTGEMYHRDLHDLDLREHTRTDLVPVGFEPVFPMSYEVFVPPGRVLYDQSKNLLFYKNKWNNCPVRVKKCTSKSYYYRFLQGGDTDKVCVLSDEGELVSLS